MPEEALVLGYLGRAEEGWRLLHEHATSNITPEDAEAVPGVLLARLGRGGEAEARQAQREQAGEEGGGEGRHGEGFRGRGLPGDGCGRGRVGVDHGQRSVAGEWG